MNNNNIADLQEFFLSAAQNGLLDDGRTWQLKEYTDELRTRTGNPYIRLMKTIKIILAQTEDPSLTIMESMKPCSAQILWKSYACGEFCVRIYNIDVLKNILNMTMGKFMKDFRAAQFIQLNSDASYYFEDKQHLLDQTNALTFTHETFKGREILKMNVIKEMMIREAKPSSDVVLRKTLPKVCISVTLSGSATEFEAKGPAMQTMTGCTERKNTMMKSLEKRFVELKSVAVGTEVTASFSSKGNHYQVKLSLVRNDHFDPDGESLPTKSRMSNAAENKPSLEMCAKVCTKCKRELESDDKVKNGKHGVNCPRSRSAAAKKKREQSSSSNPSTKSTTNTSLASDSDSDSDDGNKKRKAKANPKAKKNQKKPVFKSTKSTRKTSLASDSDSDSDWDRHGNKKHKAKAKPKSAESIEAKNQKLLRSINS